MDNVFDQINPTIEVDTTKITDTAETTAETTTAAIDTEAIQREVTTPTISKSIEISNVQKSDIDGKKRDKTSVDIILVRSESTGGTAVVYYQDTMEIKELPATVGQVKTRLPDGGVVSAIKGGKTRRFYATLRLTLDDLADKIAAIPDEAWQPRTKNRG